MQTRTPSLLPAICALLVSLWTEGAPTRGLAQQPPAPPEETGYFDGRLWRTGVPRPPYSCLATDDHGRLIVAGTGLGATGLRFADIARWDGRTWEVLATRAGGVETMVTQGSNVYVGGFITAVDGLPCNHVARFDGMRWHALGAGLGGPLTPLMSLAAASNQLYAGGAFTNSGTTPINRIARWDAGSESWLPMGEGLSMPVRAIAVGGGEVFAGSGNRVARWDGTSWETLGELGQGAEVGCLLWQDGDLYVGGGFNSVNDVAASKVARWRNGRWERVSEFELPGNATGLGFSKGRLWVSGNLHGTGGGGQALPKLASLEADGWKVHPDFISKLPCSSLCGPGPELFLLAGAALRSAQNGNELAVWQYDGSQWSPVSGGLSPNSATPSQVVASSQGAVAWGYPATLDTYPLLHDGSGFRTTQGQTNFGGQRVRLGPALVGMGGSAYASGWWSHRPNELLITQLEGTVWKPVLVELPGTPLPLTNVTRLALAPGKILAAGNRTKSTGEIWELASIRWRRVGAAFEPAPVTAPPPPTGRESSHLYSVAWHDGRIYAGCGVTLVDGQTRSNLVVWNGSAWEQFLSLSGPATLLRSAGNRLYIGSHSAGKPSLLVWDGETSLEIASQLKLSTLLGLSISPDGLVAAAGVPSGSDGIPVWFWREGGWMPPANWKATPALEKVSDCAWVGNDLYLAGISRVVSDMESIGLALWHEPGSQLIARTTESGVPALRATGAMPERFAWEKSDELNHWAPFATNALGNPGWITAPASETNAQFYRIRPLQ